MKITQKYIFIVLSVIVFFWVTGFYAMQKSKAELTDKIRHHDLALAESLISEIHQFIYTRLETFQIYAQSEFLQNSLAKSNAVFAEFPDLQKHIDDIDSRWTMSDEENGSNNKFFNELSENALSRDLKTKKDFYHNKYDYDVYRDLFVTNEYGAVAGLTGKTTDYRQDDETWWQEAKDTGLFYDDIAYDSSTETYCIIFGLRVEDALGNFLGVIKVELNIEEMTRVVKKAAKREEHDVLGYLLASRDGKVVYSTNKAYSYLEDISQEDFYQKASGTKDYFAANAKFYPGNRQLFAYVHWPGHRELKECGCRLFIVHSAAQVYEPVTNLEKKLMLIGLIVTIISLGGSVLSIRFISSPLLRLKEIAVNIGEGQLGEQVNIQSKDEIGELANAFNTMSLSLKNTTVSRDLLIKEMEERKKLEEALQQNEKFLNNIFESIQDGISVLDKDMNIVRVNHTMQKWYSHKMPLKGKKCFDAYHGLTQPCKVCPSLRALKSGKLEKNEVPFVRQEGGKGTLELFAFPLKNEANEITGVVEFVRDITNRKQMEKAIQDSEKQLSSILDSVLTGIIIINADTFEIIDANPAALSMIGTRRERLIGKKCYHHLCPAAIGKCPILDLGQEIDYSERTLIDKDGNELPILKSVSVQVINGRRCLIESFVDITDRKNAEQEREKLIEKLQKALEEINTLSGIIPICASCKKIRDDKGYWNQVEAYIEEHSAAEFSHAMCEECCEKLYGGQDWYEEAKKDGEIPIS